MTVDVANAGFLKYRTLRTGFVARSSAHTKAIAITRADRNSRSIHHVR